MKTFITSDNELIDTKFNDFFINNGPLLVKSIPHVNTNLLSFLGSCLAESIYLAPENETENGQFLKSLKHTAAGFDDLNSMCLKITSETLVQPLTHICKLFLSPGIFPEQFKITNVIP